MKQVKVILTDIEGTTSSISFVKDVLFPYAYEKLEGFVQEHKNDIEVRKILEEVNPDIKEAISILKQWIKLDLKHKPLKDLQGLIWEAGYKDGDYQGHIYDDAYDYLKAWHKQGIKLYIYSSGSVYAQKLLFGHTKFGDINNLFSGNFDTSVGNKREAKSYINIYEEISKALEIEPIEILFLSDVQEELDAAKSAGMQGFLLLREEKIDFSSIPTALFKAK